jgi:flagellar assembly protein FliH
MAQTAKYMFDEDFSGGGKPTITLVEHERRRADAESVAYRNGFAAGEAKAQEDAAARIAAALGRIAVGMDAIERALTGIAARLESEAVEVAVAVAGKLAPELIAREPFAEISALATDCFCHLVKTPHVTARVAPALRDTVREKLDEIARARGFEGRLMVLADESVAAGDCRIEWAEGGVTRDTAAARAMIDDAVARYVAARPTPDSGNRADG